MPLSYRKSLRFGPFRLNVGKRGVGVSTGARGARVSEGPSGRRVSLSWHGFRWTRRIK